MEYKKYEDKQMKEKKKKPIGIGVRLLRSHTKNYLMESLTSDQSITRKEAEEALHDYLVYEVAKHADVKCLHGGESFKITLDKS